MKLLKNFAAGLVLAILVPVWSGCQTQHKSVMPLTDGYEEVSHPNHNFIILAEPVPPRISLQYRNQDGTITPVWPSLYGTGEVIHDKLAVFAGDKAYIEPDRVTHPRLFAVKSPGLPVDITDEVLRQWSQAAGKNLNTARDRFVTATPEENEGRLELHLDFSLSDELAGRDEWPRQSTLRMDWKQVEGIMETVKARGVQQKDLRWNAPYIGEKH
jgi:hypothetical protein